MSVASIDSDTSMASTTVARSTGHLHLAGRLGEGDDEQGGAERGTTPAVTWRRQPGRFGATTSSRARLVNRTA